ncbi:hypothetical protein [Nocardiopsis potens]|uniref:hypothetical protein n=1 Tax=Nocardiopsis potens TaxID=1246458 RepID=UPI00034A528A|nr:hypothetical protein [Nocardiopsis potens]
MKREERQAGEAPGAEAQDTAERERREARWDFRIRERRRSAEAARSRPVPPRTAPEEPVPAAAERDPVADPVTEPAPEQGRVQGAERPPAAPQPPPDGPVDGPAGDPEEQAMQPTAERAPAAPVPPPRPPAGPEIDAPGVRARWRDVQGGFVDDPGLSVRDADDLAEEVTAAVIAGIQARRTALRGAWQAPADPDTETLRLTLREYRAFIDRLLDEHA